MTRALGCSLLATTILLISPLAPAPAAAELYDDPSNEFGLLLGATFPDEDLVGDDDKLDPNPLVGLRYAHLWEHLAVFGDGTWSPQDASGGDLDLTNLRGGAEWMFAPGRKWRWFVSGAGGLMRVNPESTSDFNRGFVSVGTGQRINLGNLRGLRWELRGLTTVTDSGPTDANFTNLEALLGFSFGFGGPPKDTDQDGVPDQRDDCPNTPLGAHVDESGCPKDGDGDGVWDGIDRCPDTERGWPVNVDGCPKDGDGDGVPDGLDKCPGTPRGAQVDSTGCPKDGDGDGVPDGLDKCPGTPSGTRVDKDGCPEPKPIFEPGKKTLVLEGVQFETDRAQLTAASHAVLDRVAASLKDWPEVRVEVGGHTDSSGSEAYNMTLASRRAEAVRDYLVKAGVPAAQLAVRGYGETRPIADNKTAAGMATNRRVELTQVD